MAPKNVRSNPLSTSFVFLFSKKCLRETGLEGHEDFQNHTLVGDFFGAQKEAVWTGLIYTCLFEKLTQ